MKRRTIDLVVSAGGLLLAAILLVGGMVLTSNANFAKTYVADQLGQQKITFTAADKLSDEEKAQACLVEYAGQAMTTGKQAECYANHYIGLHLSGIAGGKTYAELGAVQTDLRAQIAALPETDPARADLTTQLTTVTGQRDTVFKGETLRGLLLNAYAFWKMGQIAMYAAIASFIAAAAMIALSALGFAHARRTAARR